MTTPETNAPAMSLEQAQATVATKTAPKVTKESIEAAIETTSYLFHDQLTIAIIVMKNGFMQIGKAAPASKANFDPEVGKRYAYEDAFRGLWALCGFSLCEDLHREAVTEAEKRQVEKNPQAVAESPAPEQTQPREP